MIDKFEIPSEHRPTATGLPPLSVYLSAGEARGLSWTPLRLEVLKTLWQSGTPWGVYGLAEEMRKAGADVFPTSLYRLLDLYEAAGLVVSIATRRRVLIAPDPHQADWVALHCSGCKSMTLAPFGAGDRVRDLARLHDYAAERLVIECMGLCRSCRRSKPTDHDGLS